MRKATIAVLLTLFVSTTAAVRADDAPKGDKPGGADKAMAAPAAPRKFVTHHRFTAGGGRTLLPPGGFPAAWKPAPVGPAPARSADPAA